jgi:penicillin-binding protein 1C
LNETVIAIDPDIPDENQRVIFEAAESGLAYTWRLNGHSLPGAGHLMRWKPERGRHRLSLIGDDQAILDSIEFEVRGQPAHAGGSPTVAFK